MSATIIRRISSACLAGGFIIVLTGAVLAQPPAEPVKPADTLSMLRQEARVKSGQEFFKGAGFIGAEACKACHENQFKEWSETWHAKMERWPSPDVVIGDFNGRVITYKGTKVKTKDGKSAKISPSVKTGRKGDKFIFTLLDNDNPENNQTYEIAKVLGGNWDQHYEILLGDNYLPAPIRWSVAAGDWLISSYRPYDWFVADGTADGRPKKPNELPKGRVAEAKCAGCHTTGFEFKLDEKSKVWKAEGKGELGIACEKCHGPGSLHKAEAEKAKAANAPLKPGTSRIVQPLKDLNPLQQIQICAQCHGRNTNKTIKDVAFPLGFLPGDTDMTDRSMFWSYSGTTNPNQFKYFWPNDWAKRNRQQWQDFTKSAHFNKGEMSCLTCHTFHGKWEYAQLRQKPEALCVGCHAEAGYARRPQAEMYAGSPMEKAGVRCVDCHMAKIGYRSNKTAKGPHPWDTSSHTFLVATPALAKSSGVRAACVACHNDKKQMLPHVKKGIEVPPFSLDDLAYQQAEKKAAVRAAIGEVFAALAGVKLTDANAKALAEKAEAQVNFVILDGSMGLHNSEKATAMLDEALKLAKAAAVMK